MNNKQAILIGGPSRSGKTTLTATLCRTREYAPLPVEGLLDVFYRRPYILPNFNRKKILKDYLFQARYLDEKRENKKSPIDFFETPFEKIAAEAPKVLQHHIELIFYALNAFAEDSGKETWAACDLHGESYFHLYKKIEPEIKLVIVYRHPLENLCASMYWRHYPKKNPEGKSLLNYCMIMWMLSICTGIKLTETYGDDVIFCNLNDLISEKTGKDFFRRIGINEDICLGDSFKNEKPWFLCNHENNSFYAPNGKWEKLLNDEECAFIGKWGRPLLDELNGDRNIDNINFPKEKTEFASKVQGMLVALKNNPRVARDFCFKNMEFSRHSFYAKKTGTYKTILKNIIGTFRQQ